MLGLLMTTALVMDDCVRCKGCSSVLDEEICPGNRVSVMEVRFKERKAVAV